MQQQTTANEGRPQSRGGWWIAGIAAWLVAVASGFVALHGYDTAPGENPEPPANWVDNQTIAFDHTLPTLLVFVHPECPCTRATLTELDRLMATCARAVVGHVVFSCEPGGPADEASSALWDHARRIPGVSLHLDRGGAFAKTFHAATSGAVLLYQPNGALVFHGGITGGRGHEGDNPGRTAVTAHLLGTTGLLPPVYPVFGCALCGDATKPPERRE